MKLKDLMSVELLAKAKQKRELGVCRKQVCEYVQSQLQEKRSIKTIRLFLNKEGLKFHGKYTNKENSGRFKKGQLPYNTVRVGAVRTDKDGADLIKTNLGKWVPMSRFVWESKYGKLPKGSVVSFLDGNCGNSKIENLEVLTRVEAAPLARMGYYKLEPQHKTTMRILMKLKKTIQENSKI